MSVLRKFVRLRKLVTLYAVLKRSLPLTRVAVSNGFPSVTGKAKSCHNEYFGVVQPWQRGCPP
jgi:hypothetical protein